ncbi:MAG: arsenate reductase [Roseivirga sp.]|uniref:arsenate reductase family protein n=1 Tax=Roseivirga sp. TaxID=1964215 RepID=UPI001B037686|nr:ArsC/Spx/MgsR family protein [Roseivirga sp.]MBO6659874.1 arsenate reductase [Roseivirga sp.]MBO6760743.1 arsenate reductase [Roseivirga sp.]MBO6907389.1 arsenate reductase [Roseivirga sp.]
MKKVYYLSTCDTCKRIMSELNLEGFEKQDIKNEAITKTQVEQMKELSGSYAGLFSKVARKYRALGLNERDLTEEEMKNYILEEYTFLKRPVFIIDNEIFIGNSKKNVEALKSVIGN